MNEMVISGVIIICAIVVLIIFGLFLIWMLWLISIAVQLSKGYRAHKHHIDLPKRGRL